MNTLFDTLKSMQSYLAASGRFRGGVGIGEPKAPPADWYAALICDESEVIGTTLSGTIERRTVTVRAYHNMLDDAEQTELDMSAMYAALLSAFLGDFDLGGSIRQVEPVGTRTSLGYITIGTTMYRVMDIKVNLVVDDSATFAA